ncbi:MAG TPA: S41 family peptidase [Verrucomicrobiae bacterium]|nr:S41 family peptidase [Verrucomicrobiae bacterium]
MSISGFTRVFLRSVLALAAGAAFGQTNAPTPEQIKEKVTIHRPYAIGEEADVTLPIGQAVQFDCAGNPYWVKQFLLYAAASNQVWVCPLDAEGEEIFTAGPSLQKKQGWLWQVADTPCLAIMKWNLRDQTLRLHFCLSADKEQNQREWDEATAENSKMNCRRRNLRPFPPRKLPEAERLAGFTRLWSELKYNFALFDRVPDLDWDKVPVEYIPKVQQAETEREYLCVLARCLALLHDGHTSIQTPMAHPDYGDYGLPLEVRPLAGRRAVIVLTTPVADIRSPKRKEEFVKANLKPGEEVTHINGRPVDEILEQDIYPYISACTPQSRDVTAYPRLLSGEYGSKAVLRIKGLDGTARAVTLTRGFYPRRNAGNEFECRELANGILYVNLPSFQTNQVVHDFENIFPQVQKAKGLILDIRHNGGGNSRNGDAIISMLINKPVPWGHIRTPEYIPAYRGWGYQAMWHEEDGPPVQPSREDPFLGPIVVLTGPETFSAAEDFVVVLHASKRATLVGERSGGSTGNPLWVDLPGGVKARICTLHCSYPDGQEFVGVGVIPDVEVHPTATDIATDRDVTLEKAVDLLKTGSVKVGPSDAGVNRQPSEPVTSPADIQSEMQTLRSLWEKKKIAEAMHLMEARVASPEFGSVAQNIQTEYFYDLACGASRLGRPEEAVAYLGMAVGSGFDNLDLKHFAHLKSDPDLDPIRKNPGFLVLQEIVRARGDVVRVPGEHLAILRQHADYARDTGTNSVTFTYQSMQDPDLTRFRDTWKLESIAGNGDDASRVLNLLHWVHTQVRHDGNSTNPEPRNALHLLEVCQKEGRGVNCRMMATILNEACLALGYKARHITCLPLDKGDTDCHVITAVWLEGLQKWVYFDPTFEAYFTDPQGILLSFPEVRTRMIKGEPLVLSKGANWNGQEKDPDEYLDYMAKNFVKLRCPQQSSFGYESTKGKKAYVELDDVSIAPEDKAGMSYTHDPELFWARP